MCQKLFIIWQILGNGVWNYWHGWNTLEIIIRDYIDPNLQYKVSLGNCIKDLTEGNVLTEFIDEIDIFNKEVKEKKLPFTFIRTLNNSTKLKVSAEDLIIDVHSKM